MQMEHEKRLEINFYSNAQIEPILIDKDRRTWRLHDHDLFRTFRSTFLPTAAPHVSYVILSTFHLNLLIIMYISIVLFSVKCMFKLEA